jgi:hypothetical protein
LQGQVKRRTTKEGLSLPMLQASFSAHSICTIPLPVASVA